MANNNDSPKWLTPTGTALFVGIWIAHAVLIAGVMLLDGSQRLLLFAVTGSPVAAFAASLLLGASSRMQRLCTRSGSLSRGQYRRLVVHLSCWVVGSGLVCGLVFVMEIRINHF